METQNRETIYIQTESNGAATTSLVLGIIGFIVGLIPYIGWFMAPVWLLAVIFGLVGMRKKYKRGTAIIGFIFGLLGAAYKFGLLYFAFLAGYLSFSLGYSNFSAQDFRYSALAIIIEAIFLGLWADESEEKCAKIILWISVAFAIASAAVYLLLGIFQ